MTDEVLLGEGISNLLKKRAVFDVVNISTAGSADLPNLLMAYKPDIVILQEKLVDSKPADLVMNLMEKQQGIKIIVMNLDNNSVRIYNKQQLTITQSGDFFATLDDSLNSPIHGGN